MLLLRRLQNNRIPLIGGNDPIEFFEFLGAGGPPFAASISKTNEGAPPFAPCAKGGCWHRLSGRRILNGQNLTHGIPTSAFPAAIHPPNSVDVEGFIIKVSS